MTTSLFGVGNSINVNVNGTVVMESFIGAGGQTLFNISNFTYTPNTNSLLVFINGQRQIVSRDFIETSNSSFTLVEGVIVGDNVDIIGFPQLNLEAVNAGSVTIGGSYTLNNYLTDAGVNVKSYPFLAAGDGITDDTASINLAITFAVTNRLNLYFPRGKYRFTSTIILPAYVSINGSGPGGMFFAPDGGTQFYFDHSNVGIQLSGSALQLSNFSTLRNQPADAPGWAPLNHTYDISSTAPVQDIYFDNITFVNPTRAVKIAAGSGRIWFRRISGQPMTEGIFIEAAYDVISMNGIHWWPYWSVEPNIQEWTMNNSIGINSYRNDDPTINDYFHIWGFKSINIGQYAGGGPSLPAGTTALLKLSNTQFDISSYGYYVDAASIGHTARWTNVFFQGCQGAQSTIALTGGTAFSSFVTAGGSNYTLTLTGNLIVPVVGTYLYINVTLGTAPDGWYKVLSVTNANVFIVQGAAAGHTIVTASFTLTQKITPGLSIQGGSSRIQGTSVYFAGYQKGCIDVADTNYLGLTDLDLLSWNRDLLGTNDAINIAGTAEVRLSGNQIVGAANGGIIYTPGTGGIFRSPYWLPFIPVVTAQAGALGAVTINQAIYMNDQYIVKFMVDITINNIGTGSGDIRFTMPNVPVAGYQTGSAFGREVVSSGDAIIGSIGITSNIVIVTRYNNTFPAINGSRLVLNGSYAI